MSCKKILILTGYDYSECFAVLENMDYQVIIPRNEPLLSEVARSNLRVNAGEKLIELDYGDIQEFLEEESPDILITFGWRRIISEDVINSAELAVNIHPAILPDYKGYHPVPHVLINNEKYHGITAHLITSKMDAGDIVYQDRFEINRYSTLNEIQRKVNELMPQFLLELCKRLLTEEFNLTENDDSKTKVVAGKRTPEDSEIPLTMTVGEAYDYIRACDEYRFPAYIVVDGRKIQIKLVKS
ncbi:formyltransferase family protein [Vibrio maritimus]|uniref:formyltransferase family protein n=1 Tax=Vibrio maritimus TaxID=990268 RepID=UPI001F35F71B|nr:formyltransferase family protein [Vibrio maritimus]